MSLGKHAVGWFPPADDHLGDCLLAIDFEEKLESDSAIVVIDDNITWMRLEAIVGGKQLYDLLLMCNRLMPCRLRPTEGLAQGLLDLECFFFLARANHVSVSLHEGVRHFRQC